MKTTEQAYQRLQEKIANQISDLQGVLATHKARQETNKGDWGYVADLAMISKRLRKIIDFIKARIPDE